MFSEETYLSYKAQAVFEKYVIYIKHANCCS